MNWQEKFDVAYTRCAKICTEILTITENFEELEKKHKLFTEHLLEEVNDDYRKKRRL